jgi:hypothetical protein
MNWILKHPKATHEMLGFIPFFLSDDDPRPAREQLHEAYAHGGGWVPFPRKLGNTGFKMLPNGNMKYPGDPETQLLGESMLRTETIRVYNHAWVAIVQPDGTFEVARMD